MYLLFSLLCAVVSALPPTTFTPVFSRPSASTLGVSIANPPANTTILFGWATSPADGYATDALICAPGAVVTCLDVTCSSTSSCAARTPTYVTTNTVSASSISVVRALVGTVTLADGTLMDLRWLTAATSPGTSLLSAAAAQSQIWEGYDRPVPAHTPTTVPTFPVTFSRPSTATMGVSFPAPLAGQTLFYGWRTEETVGWPADVVICAPGFVATCLDVACSSATTCAVRNPSSFTANTVTATSINLVRTLAPLVDGGRQWLAYTTAITVIGTTTLDATAAQGKSWFYYTANVPDFTPTTTPSFPISISRQSDTAIAVSVAQPPANQTVLFGWRSAETVGWPADAIICAPGSVSTCLDVSCTSASVCTARTPTILLTNIVTATSIAVSRTMAAGNVPIVAGSKMWLAHTTSATAAGTTTLNATTAQSKTWSYYSADVPLASNEKMVFPYFLAAISALIYFL